MAGKKRVKGVSVPKKSGIKLVPALREPIAGLLVHAELNGFVAESYRPQIRRGLAVHGVDLGKSEKAAVESLLDESHVVSGEKVKSWAKKQRGVFGV